MEQSYLSTLPKDLLVKIILDREEILNLDRKELICLHKKLTEKLGLDYNHDFCNMCNYPIEDAAICDMCKEERCIERCWDFDLCMCINCTNSKCSVCHENKGSEFCQLCESPNDYICVDCAISIHDDFFICINHKNAPLCLECKTNKPNIEYLIHCECSGRYCKDCQFDHTC